MISSEFGRMGRDSILEYSLNQLDLNDDKCNVEEKEEIFTNDFTQETSYAYSDGSNGGIWRVMPLNINKFVSASYDRLAKVWVTKQTSEEIKFEGVQVLAGHKREVLSLAKLTDKIFMTGSSDGSLCLWNSENGSLVSSLKERYVTGCYSMAAIDENIVAVGACQRPKQHYGTWNHLIKIWDLAQRRISFSLEGHTGGISGLVNLNKKLIASSSADTTVRIWNVESKKAVSIFKGHSDYVYSLAKLGNEKIISASKDRTLRMIDIESEKQIGSFEDKNGYAHTSTVYDVNTLDNHIAVSGSRDGYVKIWDSRTLTCVKSIDPEDGFVYAVNFSPDGKVIAGTSGKKIIVKKDGRSPQKKIQNNAHVAIWEFRSI